MDDLISRLCKLICQIFKANYCLILHLDPTKKYSVLRCEVCEGKKYILDKKKKALNRMENKIIKMCASIQQGRVLGVPMIYDDVMGVIIIKRSPSGAPFDNFDRDMLMTIIEQAIIGIKNLQLYDEQQKIVLGSIKSMVTLLDTRIPQEYAHSSYFNRLVTAIGHQMHLDEKQIESLKYASLLHDAGKIDIPLKILTKTTKLTPKEYTIIQRHPVKGAEILRHLQILKPAVPIILHHHEKYNGTGYPSRLKKEQIPLGARIMAVADAFEAMVYGRPYRERMDISSAVGEIKKKSGKQFDPKVVEAFLKVVKKINKKNYLQRGR
ncbi:MAG: HD domain-containing protein [Candidatus Omnitrophica bacterium]|nr:HD domain-containing protein [Candidatus Omnitrophota bacterium]MBU4473444.1 HD domain-containing protein [Candidatus Omnitrophota bacterium]